MDCLRGRVPAPEGAKGVREEHEHSNGYCLVTRRYEQGGKSVIDVTAVQQVMVSQFPASVK